MTNMKKENTSSNNHKSAGRQKKKTEDTQNKILSAAREIFSTNTYKAATTRMIAKLAGVDHALIHYHFGSKDELFATMVAKMIEELSLEMNMWFKDMDKMTLKKGLPVFIDRMLDYTISNPEAMQLILINLVKSDVTETIPGIYYLQTHIESLKTMLGRILPEKTNSEDSKRFVVLFSSTVISLVGGKSNHAQLLGLDPEGNEYREWVKSSVLKIFMPWLEELLNPA